MTLQSAKAQRPVRLLSAKIISAADAETLLLASTTLRDARQEAEAILMRAQMEVKTKFAAAEADGRREGVNRFQASLLAVEQERAGLRDAMTAEAISHVFAVVNQLLPHISKEVVTENLVRDVLKRVRGTIAIELRVNPDQLPFVQTSLKSWIKDAAMSIVVKADAALKDDECIVMSESGSLKASLTEQIDALEKTIRANLHFSEAA
jgi:type III secretion system HrpE/YscL family protein